MFVRLKKSYFVILTNAKVIKKRLTQLYFEKASLSINQLSNTKKLFFW